MLIRGNGYRVTTSHLRLIAVESVHYG